MSNRPKILKTSRKERAEERARNLDFYKLFDGVKAAGPGYCRSRDKWVQWRRGGRYIVRQADTLIQWGRWFEYGRPARRVASDHVGPYWISTVFLGLDHSFGIGGRPLLYETMVFAHGDMGGDDMWRTPSRTQALAVHAAAVRKYKQQLATTADPPCQEDAGACATVTGNQARMTTKSQTA